MLSNKLSDIDVLDVIVCCVCIESGVGDTAIIVGAIMALKRILINL